MGVWKTVFPPKGPAGRVLSSCGLPDVHCEELPDGRLTVAVFIERHEDDAQGATARLRIAYRSYHPKPIQFTRRIECEGGQVSAYDAAQVLRIVVGRTKGRPYLEELVPDSVGFTVGDNGAQVDAELRTVVRSHVSLDKVFTVVVGATGRCPCC